MGVKTALRTERQLLVRHVLRRRRDAPQAVVLLLDLAVLATHQPQGDDFLLGHEMERCEAARALAIILEQEAVDTANQTVWFKSVVATVPMSQQDSTA
jgi:hypothetical protein